jgi:NAD(P)-dependent dehydrogenase (short-subunit alcohol dehydrogenase family)
MSVVVITGCSSGLGPLAALEFARRGDRVYATMRGSERGHLLLDSARAEGLDIRVLDLDVTSDPSVQRAIDQVLEAEGRIDVLVNNAGLLHFGSVELLPDDLMRTTFETNLFGPVRLLRAVLPAMRSQRSGVIVNVSSVAGRIPAPPIFWSYFASKHGLSVLSDALAMELAPHGIRVLCIEPGFFKTPIAAKGSRPSDADSPYRTLDDAVVAFIDGGVATGGEAQEIADAIVDAAARDDGPVHVVVADSAKWFLNQAQTLTEAEMISLYEELIGITAPVGATA